jgi:Ras-related protein Rab-11A
MSEDDYDMIFKVVLIGDSGVGKTNILGRYLKNEFNYDSKTTVGVEFGAKRLEIDGVKIKTQIWDTAGQERFRSITNAYYKGAKGALLVYDVTRRDTFDSINKWVPELIQAGDKQVTIILVGNKIDLESERQVSSEEGKKKAELYSNIII